MASTGTMVSQSKQTTESGSISLEVWYLVPPFEAIKWQLNPQLFAKVNCHTRAPLNSACSIINLGTNTLANLNPPRAAKGPRMTLLHPYLQTSMILCIRDFVPDKPMLSSWVLRYPIYEYWRTWGDLPSLARNPELWSEASNEASWLGMVQDLDEAHK